VIGQ